MNLQHCLEPSVTVEVRYPHARNGNAGQVSHSAKTTTREEFIRFVDMNSQPNGRSADSSGPTHYFSPQFTSIQTSKAAAKASSRVVFFESSPRPYTCPQQIIHVQEVMCMSKLYIVPMVLIQKAFTYLPTPTPTCTRAHTHTHTQYI